MDCKNCQKPLEENAHFCDNCGGKVINERLTFSKLILEFFILNFGVDSRFFLTLRKMITQPDVVINEYLSGVRRRYINPFAFLAVGAALSLILFNYFADDFIAINSSVNSEQMQEIKKKAEMEIPNDLSEKEIKKLEFEKKAAQLQIKFTDGMMRFMLQYWNLLAFAFLLLYAVLSKWTFWKPHNFGEHVVINAYIYGFTIFISIIAFIFAIVLNPAIYLYSTFAYIIYYMYTFGKLYKLSIFKNILKLLKFLLGLIVIFIVSAITIGVVAFILGSTGLV